MGSDYYIRHYYIIQTTEIPPYLGQLKDARLLIIIIIIGDWRTRYLVHDRRSQVVTLPRTVIRQVHVYTKRSGHFLLQQFSYVDT